MQTKLQLQVNPETAFHENLLKEEIRQQLNLRSEDNLQIKLLKRSIDARGRKITINVTVLAVVDEQLPNEDFGIEYPNVSESKKPVI